MLNLSVFLFIVSATSILSDSDLVCLDTVLFHRTDSYLPKYGPLCVVRTSQVSDLEEVAPIQTLDQFEDMFGPLEADYSSSVEVVMLSDNEGPYPFSLPAHVMTERCSGTQEISVGMSARSSCLTQWIAFNSTECQNSLFLSAQTLFGPSVISNEDSTIIETPFRPSSGLEFRPAVFKDEVCHDVIQEADIAFYRNGSLLTDAVVTKITYATLAASNYTTLRQTFSVEFKRATAEIEEEEEERGVRKDDEIFVQKGGRVSAMSVPSLGECSLAFPDVMTVRFGVSASTGCITSVMSCTDAQKKQISIYSAHQADFAYPTANLSMDPIPTLKSNFTLEKQSSDTQCTLITSYSIQILYARQGTESKFHHVIVGLIYSHITEELPITSGMKLQVPFKVEFRDVTRKPVDRFSSLPHIDLRLPNDFFYPFVYSSTDSSIYNIVFVLVIILNCV